MIRSWGGEEKKKRSTSHDIWSHGHILAGLKGLIGGKPRPHKAPKRRATRKKKYSRVSLPQDQKRTAQGAKHTRNEGERMVVK